MGVLKLVSIYIFLTSQWPHFFFILKAPDDSSMHPGLGTQHSAFRPCSLSTASYLLPSDTHMSTLSGTSLEVPLLRLCPFLWRGTYSILLGELRCHVKNKMDCFESQSLPVFSRREAGSSSLALDLTVPPFPPWQRVPPQHALVPPQGSHRSQLRAPGCGASSCAGAVGAPYEEVVRYQRRPTDKHRLIVLVGMCRGQSPHPQRGSPAFISLALGVVVKVGLCGSAYFFFLKDKTVF